MTKYKVKLLHPTEIMCLEVFWQWEAWVYDDHLSPIVVPIIQIGEVLDEEDV